MSSLNGFTLQAVGTLARNPELVAKENTTFVRFCLVGNNHNIDENGTTCRQHSLVSRLR